MAKPCCREGCEAAGTYYPVLVVPPMGGTIRQALQLVVGVEVCRRHLGEIEAGDFLSAELRQRVRISLMQMGRAMPDFERAEVDRGSVGDRRWLAFRTEGSRSNIGRLFR